MRGERQWGGEVLDRLEAVASVFCQVAFQLVNYVVSELVERQRENVTDAGCRPYWTRLNSARGSNWQICFDSKI